MAAPPPPPMIGAPNIVAPPLPPGWTEHVAPGGQSYFYNAFTKESTYVRPLPLPAFPGAMPPFAPSFGMNQQFAPSVAPAQQQGKKEKPKMKTPIPGTPWLRVVTTAGNVFYTNKEKRESVWSVPEEIKDAVAQLEAQEQAQVQEEHIQEAQADEVNRVKEEVEQAVRKAKRKAIAEPELVEEMEIVLSKKVRVEDEGEEESDEESESDEEEEDWQREAAAQLAAEAEEEERRRMEAEEEKKREEEELKRKEKERGVPALSMPARVDLSIEEGKALFKTLLREKDINPLLPWDTALPKFISDPRYVLLPSVAARRDAFDEYCKERARELRAAKVAASKASPPPSTGDGDLAESANDKQKAKEDFDKLLKDEVKSTRTSWTDWRRQWKKDRRFWGWGRDDREREKRFREWVRELGEKKRKAAQKAETDFFALLREKASDRIKPDSAWKDVKKGLDKDPRYDAVGSSSLREELFNTYIKILSGSATSPSAQTDRKRASEASPEEDEAERKSRDKERKERAVREREEQVKRERGRVEAQMAKSRSALSREEGELEFMSLLTDAIREPTVTWDSSVQQLSTDPRYTHSPLPSSVQQTLFSRHVTNLRSKYITALHALFESYAPSLEATFPSLSPSTVKSIQSSLPAQKLRYSLEDDPDARYLGDEFRQWRRDRLGKAERDFQEMLNENAFVEFWGRLRKMQEETQVEGMKVDVGAEDLAGEEGEDNEGKPDLKTLAKSIDVKEIERALKNDKRYTIFDHIPEQREVWIRAHVEKLAAPKLSVHVPEHS